MSIERDSVPLRGTEPLMVVVGIEDETHDHNSNFLAS